MEKIILVTNDDGLNSAGILTLAKALRGLGEIWIVAPDRDRSNSSHRLTLNFPLRLEKVEHSLNDRVYSTNGTPSDCVYLALSHLLASVKVDLVVSGINKGFNLADDITYSGTVGAAFEAVLLDVPAIAISAENFTKKNLDISELIIRHVSSQVLTRSDLLPSGVLLNINVPENAKSDNFLMTTIGRRRYSKEVKPTIDPKGTTHFWIGGEPQAHERIPGSDCNAVLEQKITSITPITHSMTCFKSLELWKSIQDSKIL